MSKKYEVDNAQLMRILRAVTRHGNLLHRRADDAQNSSNFDLRDDCRLEGNKCYELARELRTQRDSA